MDEFELELLDLSNSSSSDALVVVADKILLTQMKDFSESVEIPKFHHFDEFNSCKSALLCALKVRQRAKDLDAKRKEMVKPFNDKKNEINKEFKYYNDLAEEIQDKIKEKLLLSIDLMTGSFDKIDCEIGSLYPKKQFSYEITDKDAIKDDYWMINEEKIEKDIKNGVINIDGIKIYEKTEFEFRLK